MCVCVCVFAYECGHGCHSLRPVCFGRNVVVIVWRFASLLGSVSRLKPRAQSLSGKERHTQLHYVHVINAIKLLVCYCWSDFVTPNLFLPSLIEKIKGLPSDSKSRNEVNGETFPSREVFVGICLANVSERHSAVNIYTTLSTLW